MNFISDLFTFIVGISILIVFFLYSLIIGLILVFLGFFIPFALAFRIDDFLEDFIKIGLIRFIICVCSFILMASFFPATLIALLSWLSDIVGFDLLPFGGGGGGYYDDYPCPHPRVC